jgi:hypothetical protein
MEIIFSNIYNENFEKKKIYYKNYDINSLIQQKTNLNLELFDSTFSNFPATKEILALANFYCKNLGFKTTFFGDQKSLNLYKNIEFDEFKIIPDNFIKEYYLQSFWSIGKLYALRQTYNHCFHIDSDLFLIRPLPDIFLNQDLVCFYEENYVQNFFENTQNLFNISPVNINLPNNSYNCAIMGGKDFKSMHKAIDILLSFYFKNRQYINEVSKKHKNLKNFYPTSLFEQVWLFQILKCMKKQIASLIEAKDYKSYWEETQKRGYVHLTYRKWFYQKTCEQFVKKYNIKY